MNEETMMMRKITVTLLAALLLVLTGCAGDFSPRTDPVVAEPDQSVREEAFLLTMRNDAPVSYTYSSDAELLQIGYAACDLLDVMTLEEIASYLVMNPDETHSSMETYGFTLGAAGTSICPEHAGAIDRFANS